MMILFLLGLVAGIGVTGWMMTLDAFWGNGTVEMLHTLFVDVALVSVAIHVCANIYASLRHRENLVWAMITGFKRAAEPETQLRGSPAAETTARAPRATRRTPARPTRASTLPKR